MAKGLFITGTGTDVGKTYVTALIVKKLREAGLNAGYYKAALSGAERRDGRLVPGDAEFVYRTAGLAGDPAEAVSYIYERPYSPHLAAKLAGCRFRMEAVREDFKRLSERYDLLAVEGSGGIVCPISCGEGPRVMLADIVTELGLPAVVVSGSGLGAINAAVLTVSYLRARGIEPRAVIMNNWVAGGVIEEDNRKMIEALAEVPVAALVARGAEDIGVGASALLKLYGEED
ncbi:MAG: dethiobiotin synthase [bacterium]|nr:dethiobiotin synthase [bacterium]